MCPFFGVRRFKHIPISENVGNGRCRSGDLPGISPLDSNGAQPTRYKSFPRGKLARPWASLMRAAGQRKKL